jgi:hypothetical protein
MNLSSSKTLVACIIVLVLCGFLFVAVNYKANAQIASTDATSIERDCNYFTYMPLVVQPFNTLARISPALTIGPSILEMKLPCIDPGPITGLLVDPDANEDLPVPIHPNEGVCPKGTHPVHSNGWPNFGEEDDEGWTFTDSDYTCEPDEILADADCTQHGKPELLGGLAACQCEPGYAGATCDVCAPGYILDVDSQTCREAPQLPEPKILGVESSLEVGGTAIFEATDTRGNPIQSTWSLGKPQVNDPNLPAIDFLVDGCLFEVGGDQTCQASVTGTQVGYLAPEGLVGDAPVKMVQLNIDPFSNPGFGLATESIVVVGAGGIPITGHGDPRMEPILNALSRYMRQRCIGAAMLGVSRYGFPLAVYGLGREDGRASASWHDYCGDDEGLPLAAPITNETPLRMGSANKPVTFAILRWVLKERLEDDDTDLDVVSLTNDRFVTVQRTTDGDAKLIVWDIAGDGTLSQVGEDVYDPGPVNSIETKIRDLSLIALPSGYVVLGANNSTVPWLQVWNVLPSGDLVNVANLPIGYMVDLKLIPLMNNLVSDDRFAAAVRDDHGALDVRVYELSSGNQINLLDSFEIEDAHAREVALTDVSESTFSRVVVGIHDGDQRIVLRTFDIAADGSLSQADQFQTAPAGDNLSLVTLNSNRIVAAVRKVFQDNRLWLTSWSVAFDGELQLQDSKLGDPINDLSLTALNGSRVLVADRLASNGNLQMVSYDVDGSGNFTLLDDDGGGGLSGIALKSLTTQRAILALRNSSNNLENILWDIDSGGTLSRVDEAVGGKVPDSVWTDDEVEDLRLVGFDLPELLLPARVHAILRGDVEPPVYIHRDDCPDLTDFADPQWQQVKVGNVLRHSTGLPKSAPGLTEQVENLHLLRDLNSLPDFAAQETILRAEFGNPVVDTGKATLGYGGESIFVLPEATLEEIFILVGGRCLPYALGDSHYSNSSASLSGLIIDHLAGRFAATVGYPASHNGSAVDLFYDYQLGIQTSGDSGAFYSQRVFGLPGYSFPDPNYRIWSSSGTYYPTRYDDKRPHCVWDGNGCSFDDWFDGSHGILRWLWDSNQPVPFDMESSGAATGAAGNLSIEPGVHLSFMRNYWINNISGDSNPEIGEKRENVWDSFRTHNGSADGTKARTFQLGHTDNPYSLDFQLPRKYDSPYLPIVGDDTFGNTESAFFTARADTGNVQTGHIYTTLSNGVAVDLTEVQFKAGDLLAVGMNMYQNNPDSFYVARHDTGLVEIFEPGQATKYSSFVDFTTGDGFAVDDIYQSTVADEFIIGDASNGEIRIYPSPPISVNGVAIPLQTYNLNFSPGDELGVGDANGNGTNELFIARAVTGMIDIYGADGSFWMQFDAGYSVGDAFAVGDVVGTLTDRDEIIIGREQSHNIEVYTYHGGAINSYQLYTSFIGLYTADGDLAVNDLGYGSHLNEIIVGVPGYGLAIVFKAQKIGGEYQFFLQDYWAFNVPFAPGDQVAAGFWRGLHRYRCSFGPYGSRQSDFPDGVDIVLAINTSSDQQCTDSGDCGSYFGDMRDNTLLYGVCEIDWSNILK